MRAAQGPDSPDRLGMSNHRLNCKTRTLEPVMNLLHVGAAIELYIMLILCCQLGHSTNNTVDQGRNNAWGGRGWPRPLEILISPLQNECVCY